MSKPGLSDLFITPQQAQSILQAVGFPGVPSVCLLKRENDIYCLTSGDNTFFLKIYTKPWYANDIASTTFCVDHEVAAWRVLESHGLAVPQVVAAACTSNNPLRRPFLLTRALAGHPLTALADVTTREQLAEPLQALGRYLRQMHGIRFHFPGYISSEGPYTPPADGEWQHFIWTASQFNRTAQEIWQQDRTVVSADLLDQVQTYWKHHREAIVSAYSPPRFVHGDCHAHQFFLLQENHRWTVTGVLDMEVASAGDPGADLLKLYLEMAGSLSPATKWWEALHRGYGEPDFNLMKLRFLAAAPINYKCLGERSWPGSREQILRHLLSAKDWQSLFNLELIVDSGP